MPKDWRPRGVPVAHLHEHRAAVNRLVSIPDTSLFASNSSDGCIKIWDASKMEGRNIANRSRYIFFSSRTIEYIKKIFVFFMLSTYHSQV